MSDFDKEAEREKLREKYEQEQKEREATEQMSELLLQGATMTNAHCSDCGNPIFRYDGQEFCPSCEKAVDRGTGAENGDEESSDTADEAENIEVTSPDDGARVAFGGENVQDQQAAADADQQAAADAGQQAPAQSGDASPEAETDRQPQQPQQAQQPQQSQQPQQPEHSTPAQPQSRSPAETRQPQEQTQPQQSQTVPSVQPNAGGDVSTARDALVRTLTRFSQQAEATNDPQRAQEYLAAAREAAETLAALRQ